ncbi:Flp family type IVb pilin [Vibrio sp. SCSIO 43135]|nr:Flp family type IVb pilin [Vibrio sp. SCSIO 43135]USD40144.1 Flp family type IVb pilin [Vibrio sp. SCSIO 43135]
MLNKFACQLLALKNDERGVTAIEYAIIGVAMSAIVLAVFNGSLQDALEGAMTTISDHIGEAGDNVQS